MLLLVGSAPGGSQFGQEEKSAYGAVGCLREGRVVLDPGLLRSSLRRHPGNLTELMGHRPALDKAGVLAGGHKSSLVHKRARCTSETHSGVVGLGFPKLFCGMKAEG